MKACTTVNLLRKWESTLSEGRHQAPCLFLRTCNSDFEARYKESTAACEYITIGAFSQWLYKHHHDVSTSQMGHSVSGCTKTIMMVPEATGCAAAKQAHRVPTTNMELKCRSCLALRH